MHTPEMGNSNGHGRECITRQEAFRQLCSSWKKKEGKKKVESVKNVILASSSRLSLYEESQILFQESESLEEDVHFVVVLAGGGGWKTAGN
jgi:hypothetical protein